VQPNDWAGTEPNQFSDKGDTAESEEAFLARLRAFVAPVADNKGAVIEDFDGTGEGLTVEQIRTACPEIDSGTFDSRITLFKH
jgi:hypothetical protein